jgi:Neisseria meningitidis TspB protein
MRLNHVSKYRVGFRLGFLLASVFGSSVSVAGEVGTATTFMGAQSGGSWTVRFGSDGTPLLTTASPGLPTGSGWQQAGNFGMTRQGDDIAFGGKSKLPMGGSSKLDIDVTGKANKASMGKALAKFAKTLGPVGAALGAMELLSDINVLLKGSNDGAPNGNNKFMTGGYTTQWRWPTSGSDPVQYYGTALEACWGHLTWASPSYPWQIVMDDNGVTYRCRDTGGNKYGPIYQEQTGGPEVPLTEQEVADRIAAKSGWPTSTRLAETLLEAMKSGAKVEVGPASVTVPTAQPEMQPKTTTKETVKTDPATGKPQRTVETATTETKCTTNGEKVLCGEKTTTTTQTFTKETDGSETPSEPKTETEEETTDKPKETDLCEKHPDILACAKPELDTPDGEIPRATETITYQEENLFGGGSCPTNAVANLGTVGRSFTVWDWEKTCNYALPLRAVVIALATFAAFIIVMPDSRVSV